MKSSDKQEGKKFGSSAVEILAERFFPNVHFDSYGNSLPGSVIIPYYIVCNYTFILYFNTYFFL